MADTAYALPPPRSRGRPRTIPPPTAEERKLVEVVAGLGVSQAALCHKLTAMGWPSCKSIRQLKRRFGPELQHGREHLITGLGRKVLEIALSDRPNNLSAAIFLLRTLGGPMWREPKNSDESPVDAPRRVVDTDGEPVEMINNVIFRMPPNGRDRTEEPADEEPATIDGEAKAADE
jgi:hypothetical protein